MRIVVVALATLASSGCLAASARLRAGGVFDDQGTSAQVALDLAIGFGTGNGGAVIETVGVTAGSVPSVGLDLGLDYVKLASEHPLGWRVGFGGAPLAAGDATALMGRAALLLLVRDHDDPARHHEKSELFDGGSRFATAIGLELGAGETYRGSPSERAAAGSAALTLELFMIGHD